MFLKQVYKYNKGLFGAIILFIAAQAFINFNHGAVLSPFYLYGMYSQKLTIQKQYDVLLIEVNGKILQGADFSIQQWDKINVPIYTYLSADSINNNVAGIRNRLLKKFNTGFLTGRKRNDTKPLLSPDRFVLWYKTYLQQITRQPITSLSINSESFLVYNGKLTPGQKSNRQPILPVWKSPRGTEKK